jgi:hypothetical protein
LQNNETFCNTHVTRRSNLTKFFYGSLSPLRPGPISPALYPPPPPLSLCPLYGPPAPSRPFAPSTAFCHLYGPMSPLRPLSTPWPPVPSTALCHLYGPLSSLRPSVTSTSLYHLYVSLSHLQPFIPSTAECPVYCPLSPLWPSVRSMGHCLLYGPLAPYSPLPSATLYLFYGLLSPLRPSVPSTALFPPARHVFSHYFAKWGVVWLFQETKLRRNGPFRETFCEPPFVKNPRMNTVQKQGG